MAETKVGSYTGGHNASIPRTNREKNYHEEQNWPANLRQPDMKLLGGGVQLVCGRPTLALIHAKVRGISKLCRPRFVDSF